MTFDRLPPQTHEVKWGFDRWYHHVIPVVLGLIVLAVAIVVLIMTVWQADWPYEPSPTQTVKQDIRTND